MINISVDEAYAFDMLAILQIKSSKSEEDYKNYVELLTNIVCQLGEVSDIVLKSEEYANMISVNQRVFDLIEKVVTEQEYAVPDDWHTAFEVHTANMARFYAKKILQEKFFGNDLMERKTVE